MRTLLSSLAALALCVSSAAAGDIGGAGTIVGDGTGSISILTQALNNDEEPGPNPNSVLINLSVNGMGVIDKLLPLGGPTGGVTEYPVTEKIRNNTNVKWADYHLELGWLVAGEYRPSVAGDGLDFDWGLAGPSNTPPPSSTALVIVVNNVSEDLLDYYSLGPLDVVVPGGQLTLTYNIDIPDPPLFNPTHVVIRQFATPVPEPASVMLLAVGAAMWWWRRRP